jgi:hypothetical protein
MMTAFATLVLAAVAGDPAVPEIGVIPGTGRKP